MARMAENLRLLANIESKLKDLKPGDLDWLANRVREEIAERHNDDREET